jgi:hypothetical protein
MRSTAVEPSKLRVSMADFFTKALSELRSLQVILLAIPAQKMLVPEFGARLGGRAVVQFPCEAVFCGKCLRSC